VVNIGRRQEGRERGPNVVDASNDQGQIAAAIEKQMANGRYECDTTYGNGDAGKRIAHTLLETESVEIQKRILI
jgi:hypothetical protein